MAFAGQTWFWPWLVVVAISYLIALGFGVSVAWDRPRTVAVIVFLPMLVVPAAVISGFLAGFPAPPCRHLFAGEAAVMLFAAALAVSALIHAAIGYLSPGRHMTSFAYWIFSLGAGIMTLVPLFLWATCAAVR